MKKNKKRVLELALLILKIISTIIEIIKTILL